MQKKYFQSANGKLALPLFFPDATRAVVKTLDSQDIANTRTPGILVNTFHLWQGLEKEVLAKFNGIGNFMNWHGALISDSGGFQVMSLIKSGKMQGKIADEGIVFYPGKNKRKVFTPEESIKFQLQLKTDLVVVLDDFTDPKDDYEKASLSVERTIAWAKRAKKEFGKIRREDKNKPYLLGVVQGGEFLDLRKTCTQELVKIGFDGLGWGGWPIINGKVNFASAEIIAENTPPDYFLYGLGIGKPEDIIKSVSLGYSIFDCVLPTRNGRHGRLYVFEDSLIKKIDIKKKIFSLDDSPVSRNCDCLLCQNYSKAYLAHLFRLKDPAGMRLASIHNLRFYAMVMNSLRNQSI